MSDHQNNQTAALLVGIGELKGQMHAIQGFLTSHTERMDRQDERMDRQDDRMNDFSRKLHEHTREDMVAHDGLTQRIQQIGDDLARRVTDSFASLQKDQSAESDKLENQLKDHSERIEKKLSDHGKRIGTVETKMAVWAGVGTVIAGVAPVLMKMMGWLS